MASINPGDRGPLYQSIYADIPGNQPIPTAIAFSENAELYLLTNIERTINRDPSYLLITDNGIEVEFGETGLVQSVGKKISRKIEGNEVYSIENVLDRDEQGNFSVNRLGLPVNGVEDYANVDDEQMAGLLINYAYEMSRTIENDKDNKLEDLFYPHNGESVIARFHDTQGLISSTDIIPDQNDIVSYFKAGDRCGYSCLYCPEGGNIELYTMDQLIENITNARQVFEKHHTTGALRRMTEGFPNISDILWYDKLKDTKANPDGVTAEDILVEYKRIFPELDRMSAFMGVRNILELCNTGDPNNPYDSGSYSPNFLKTLTKKGLTRAFIGIETGNTQGSALMRKKETYEMKKKALELVKEARIGVKAILQGGLFGNGFYVGEGDEKKLVSIDEINDDTAKLMAETKPYRIIFSKFLPLKGLELFKHPNFDRIVQSETPTADRDIADIIQKIELKADTMGPRYWQGQQGKRNQSPPFELDYEKVVEGRIRSA